MFVTFLLDIDGLRWFSLEGIPMHAMKTSRVGVPYEVNLELGHCRNDHSSRLIYVVRVVSRHSFNHYLSLA